MQKRVVCGSRDLMAMIFSNQVIIILLLIPYFKTSYFEIVPGFAIFCNAMLILECIFFGIINIMEKRLSTYAKLIFILEIWVYFLAPLISKAERPSFFYFAGAIGLLSFFELGVSRNQKNLIYAISNMFTVFILLNFVTILFKSNSFMEDGSVLYLFGLRTGFSLFIIPGILFNLIKDKYRGKCSLQTIITFVIGSYSLFSKMVVTGICEFLIILILLILLRRKKIAEKINFMWVAAGLVLINLSMTILGEKNIIMVLISSMFNKDISLSGRTVIWKKVIEKIAECPVAGVGKDAVVEIGMTLRPAHNQWLHLAMEGGYVAMVIGLIAVIGSFVYLNHQKQHTCYTVISICTIAILVGTITEIQTYVPFFFVVFDLIYILNDTFRDTQERRMDFEKQI